MQKRLFRSRTDVILGGVCAGLGDYAGIDPTYIRLFFVLFTLAGGAGVLIYILLWILVPQGDSVPLNAENLSSRIGQMGQEFSQAVSKPDPRAGRYIGIGLVLTGLFLLLRSLNIPWLNWIHEDMLWSLLLIVGGSVLIWRTLRGEK